MLKKYIFETKFLITDMPYAVSTTTTVILQNIYSIAPSTSKNTAAVYRPTCNNGMREHSMLGQVYFFFVRYAEFVAVSF